MPTANPPRIWPEPDQWTPKTTVEAMKENKFNDTIFQNMEKEELATKLVENLHANGKSWKAAVPRSSILTADSGAWHNAMESLIDDGYVREAGDKLYVTGKLKDVLVHTTLERATGVRGKMAALKEAAREAEHQAQAAAEALGAKVEAVAAKDGRAWYQFATHSLEDGKAAFSTPRTLVSGAVVLGTGLAAAYFLQPKKAEKPENWQERAQPTNDTATVQR